MKKEIQLQHNEKVLKALEEFNRFCNNDRNMEAYIHVKSVRLRNCQAWVCKIDKWYVLKSYNTIVALIDSETDTLYDFLRYVWGYSSTSCQHIRKFEKDYCRREYSPNRDFVRRGNMWGCDVAYTWREV